MPAGQVFENAWDCETCGTKGIGALKYKTCPNCGASAPGADKEYIADLNHPLTDFTALEAAKQDANWICRFCHTRNPATKTDCTQCGNSRSASDAKVDTIDYGTAAPTSAPVKKFVGDSKVTYKPNNAKRAIIAAIIVVILAIIGGVAFMVLHKTTTQGQVTGFAWNRQVNIDIYQTVQEHGRSVPPGGRMTSSRQVIDHYNKTYRTDHVDKTCYRNNGNGSSSSYDCGYDQQVLVSSDPVYATEYSYDIERWIHSRSPTASGTDHNPLWPDYTLAANGAQVIGGERVNSKNETYTVNFTDSNKKLHTLTTSLANWTSYQVEQTYPLVLDFRGAIVNDPLQPDKVLPTATTIPPTDTPDSTGDSAGDAITPTP